MILIEPNRRFGVKILKFKVPETYFLIINAIFA